jgi:MOSC domain-containing protein YiiM
VNVTHLSMDALSAGLDHIAASPKDAGPLKLIVRRPQREAREVLTEGILSLADGLVGDGWRARMDPGEQPPDTQITIMNARLAALIAQDDARWPLAGDQLYVDLDLSQQNLPPGTRLSVGSAILEVVAEPHTGCRKFVSRFGLEAMKFVNSPIGRQMSLRGVYAKVVQAGTIRQGDMVAKIV